MNFIDRNYLIFLLQSIEFEGSRHESHTLVFLRTVKIGSNIIPSLPVSFIYVFQAMAIIPSTDAFFILMTGTKALCER